MKETRIVMLGNHPRLVLDGKKTQTRRVIVPQPEIRGYLNPSTGELAYYWKGGRRLLRAGYGADYVHTGKDSLQRIMREVCPYGQAGDRLIMLEKWAVSNGFDDLKPSQIPRTAPIYYLCDDLRDIAGVGRHRSARFMCNWMSRAKPEITEVKAERLQEITEEDCYKEGLDLPIGMMLVEPHWMTKDILRRKFKALWDSLNAKRGHGWKVNPSVWVLDSRVSK